MNKEKPYIYKRLIAYFIDMFIIVTISTILTNYVIKDKDYIENSNKLMDLVNQTMAGEITQEEYNKQYDEINYELSKITDITIIMSVISIAYYVIFAYCRDGVTIGKQVMRIKIVSNNGKALHINNYLVRALFINRISLDIIDCTLVMFLSKANYLKWFNNISTVYSLLLIVSLIMMFYRNDGRGLQDIIANTKIVNINKDKVNQEVDVKEAEYEELPNIIQVDSKDIEEEKEKEEKKKSKKKNKKINESLEGVSESERI